MNPISGTASSQVLPLEIDRSLIHESDSYVRLRKVGDKLVLSSESGFMAWLRANIFCRSEYNIEKITKFMLENKKLLNQSINESNEPRNTQLRIEHAVTVLNKSSNSENNIKLSLLSNSLLNPDQPTAHRDLPPPSASKTPPPFKLPPKPTKPPPSTSETLQRWQDRPTYRGDE